MRPLPDHVLTTIHRLEAGLRSLYGVRFRGLLLFGSYARGEADEGSDIDLLLLLEGPVNATREIVAMEPVTWPLTLELDTMLSVLPVSAEDFERGRSEFLTHVRREAVAAA